MKRKLLIVILTLCILSCKKETKIAQVNKLAPNYTFKNILNSKENEISIRDLKGKIIILEFWATWCGPCLPAMKKLDHLQKDFKDEIEVITVSSENRERLEDFIKRSNTSLRIVSDSTHTTNFKYNVIPHTIIIDKDGIVRAITHPKNITKEVLNKLISNNEMELDLKDDFYIDPTLEVKTIKTAINSNYRIELKSYEQGKRGVQLLTDSDGNSKGIEMWNRTIPGLYMNLFEIPTFNRIVFKDGLNENDFPFEKEHRFSLKIEVSKKYQNKWKKMGIKFLNENFDVNAKMSSETLDCYVLKNIGNSLKKSASDTTEYQFMGSILKTKKIKMSQLAEYLENFTALPVVDITGLNEAYDIDLDWQEADPKTLYSELKKYGLKLQKSDKKRPIKVMKVYKKKIQQ